MTADPARPSLAGQVALVTGASQGIGRVLAVALAEAGLDVGLVGRSVARLKETARMLRPLAGRGVVVPADVTVAEQVAAAVHRLESALGPVDLLVNNAGRIESTEVPVWQSDPEDWWATVETNLRGPYLVTRAVMPGMVERGRGRIVAIASGAGLRDSATYSAYGSSKAAATRLTGSIAQGGAAAGVLAFDLSPGIVRTAMTRGMPVHRDRPDEAWTAPQDVAGLLLAIAAGRLDALSGRHLRAGVDTVDELLAAAERIAGSDARTLRLRPYGDGDPLG